MHKAYISIAEAADIWGRPHHQARRTTDQLWPDLPRVAGARLVPREKLCQLAAAIERRFGHVGDEVTS